jgi:hypothetical protein
MEIKELQTIMDYLKSRPKKNERWGFWLAIEILFIGRLPHSRRPGLLRSPAPTRSALARYDCATVFELGDAKLLDRLAQSPRSGRHCCDRVYFLRTWFPR